MAYVGCSVGKQTEVFLQKIFGGAYLKLDTNCFIPFIFHIYVCFNQVFKIKMFISTLKNKFFLILNFK